MIGTTLAHYRITAALGAGGMGEVWRATDTRLGRDVALKVLPTEFADDAQRLDRFEREARAVASLNHPHIVTIYSVEDAEGVRFLTMELVDGQTLEGMIPDGGFDLGRFFELATPLAEAMSAAHDKSVVHRDLKPSNVMVDKDGRVKVMDFGLAKLQETGDPSDSSELPTEALTGVGMIVGTVPYMSPEQIEGQIVDHRTDIFSLGVLLYEIAVGERPFQGKSSPALMSSILRDVPTPVVELRADFPRHLGRIINRCLEKNRRDRYQTARDVFNELKALQRESSSLAGMAAASQPRVGNIQPQIAQPSSDFSATARSSSASRSIPHDDGFWVAVLPFQCRAGDSTGEALAEGLTEDIVTGLSRFSYLRVISRSSTSRFAGQTVDVRTVGEELGARYVIEGSIRQAGSVLRVTVQLVDAETGAHLWAETYNRPFSPEEIFELQDDIAPRITSTIADMNGILPHTMSELIRSRPVDELSPYEAMLRGFGYYVRLDAEDHAEARACLEKAVVEEPGNADCWALLSVMYAEEHKHGFNVKPQSLDRSLEAARKAVSAAPSNHFAHHSLAQALFFRRELPAFRIAAERAVALNPMDGCTTAFMGILMAYAGQWDEGCALAERAMQLNPHHPGWYRFSIFLNAYRKKDYTGALDVALKINMPTYFFTHASLASVYGQLGEHEAARRAVCELLTQKPDFAATAREEWEAWIGPGELLEELLDGLRRAGLDVAAPGGRLSYPSSVTAVPEEAGAVGIAVLPFADLSPAKDQDYFCEGMAEEIMNALVHVDGIQVASRTSAFKAVEQGGDLRAIGRALAVGQVLEGSVRMAGSRLRVTAQLTEIESGYQLWSERYDREAADVFAIQDEIAAGVVEAVTSRLDSGVRTVPARVQVANLEAYQLYLKGRHFRYSKNDHANALKFFEDAVSLDREHAPSWVGRAEATVLAAVYSLIPAREAFQTAKDSLATAVGLQGESAEGCYVEGMIAFCERRWQDSEAALRRAIELQPTFVQAHCWLGFFLSVHLRRDEAESSFATACEIDPLAAYPYGMKACGQLTVGRPRQAIDPAGQAMIFDRENTLALWCSGIAKVATGGFAEGIIELEAAVRHSRRGGFILGILGWGLAVAGRRDEAEAVLEELRSRPKPAPTVVPEAWILAALGDFEGAWKVLRRVEEESQVILFFAGMPPFDPLRSDPRFDGLLERLGLPALPSRKRTDRASDADPSSEQSIAVLPFVNRSGNPDDEYFSDGLSEELINTLSRIPGLKVTARSSAFQFRGQELDVRGVGRKLGVATVLEGSVRINGNRLRITTELVNCTDGYQLWSEKFDREITDIFDTQDEIAGAIVDQLHVELGATGTDLFVAKRTQNMDAYRLYLKGRYLRHTKNDHAGAMQCYEEAVRLDPTHGPSWVGVAEVTVLAAFYSLIPSKQAYAKAKECLATAAKLQGENGESWYVEGLITFLERRWSDWEAARLRAFKLEPTNIQALGSFGMNLCARRRLDEATVLLDRAREVDPLSAFAHATTGAGLLTCGRLQECGEHFDAALEIEKENVLALWGSGIAHVVQGRLDDGVAALEAAAANSRRAAVILGMLGWAHSVSGRTEHARKILDEIRARPKGSPAVVTEAWLLAGLGEMDEAWEVLERAEEEYQGFLSFAGLPPFEQFHGDPRFQALVERLGLPPLPSCERTDSAGDSDSSPEKSIAVLPFVNMSADPENEYFSDGLSEEIINALTRLPGLRVIARTSAFRFRGEQDLRKVGEVLGVETLLEGSVRKAGQRLRITAQLIDVADDSHIWSERFDRDLVDVFAIQDEISAAIVEKLHLSLGAGGAATRERANVAAFEALLEARHFFFQFTPKAAERALVCTQRALSLEPEYPDALVQHAVYHVMMAYMFADPREVLPEAKSLAERALELDPHHGEAQATVALVATWMERDWAAGERLFRKALALAPASARVHELYGLLTLLGMGRLPEALAELDRAVELDPLSALYAGNRGRVLTCSRRFVEAEESCRHGLALDPGQLLAQVELIYALTFQGRFEEAVAIGRRAIDDHGPTKAPVNAVALSLALAGERDEAWELIDPAAEPGSGAYRSPLTRALVHAVCSKMDAAFECVHRAIDEWDPLLMYLEVHPMFDALRDDPRYPKLLQRMNLHEGSRK